MENRKCDLSIIIPCYKSEGTIQNVITEVENTLHSLNIIDYEIIAIDDCSPDDVFSVLKQLGEKNPRIKAIRFSKNFGQHAGMMAGLKHSSGEVCVYIDDDGQCPIDCLPDLLKPLSEGYDIAIAKYVQKKQSTFKNFGSLINEVAANILIDKPHNIRMSNFIVFKRFIADEISRYQGPFPYISGLLFRSSAKVINVTIEERKRISGTTTYTLKKLISLWINSFTAFSIKPLRLATVMGIISAIIGFVLAIVTVIRKLMNPSVLVGWSSTIAILLFIGGMILFVLGIIGEYVGRIYMTINSSPQYVIAEKNNL